MVPADRLQNIRIVEDKVDTSSSPRRSDGTKVSQDPLMVGTDTLFPLQGALGYKATQALFVGEHTLLVEGPSDILYLHALSHELQRRGKESLDKRWTICPAGGIDKIMPFISLFAGNNLHVAVLSDVAHGVKNKLQKIRESDVLRAGHFYTVVDFVEQNEADIEDLFDPEFYVMMVNSSFQLTKAHQVSVEKLSQDQTTPRIVKKVENFFNTLPDEIPVFDHFTPADWLIRHPQVLSESSADLECTFARAEKIFRTFNELLT